MRDFSRAKPEGNPEEQPCQPEENPILPDSFTQIYILFLIVFRIGPSKIHRGFRIGFLRSIDGSVLALLKCIDGSVLALLRFLSIFSHQNSTDGEFCWPLLLWQKSNKTTYLKYNVYYHEKQGGNDSPLQEVLSLLQLLTINLDYFNNLFHRGF